MSEVSALEKLRARQQRIERLERERETIERYLQIEHAQHIRRNNAKLNITYIAMTIVYLCAIFLFFHIIG